jgi:hypothetical protein
MKVLRNHVCILSETEWKALVAGSREHTVLSLKNQSEPFLWIQEQQMPCFEKAKTCQAEFLIGGDAFSRFVSLFSQNP